MLKKRIIANLTLLNGIVVQSFGFNKYLPIGKPGIAVEFLNQWGIDEIIISDISASRLNKPPLFDTYKKLSLKCNVPLTIGGGIKSVDCMRKLLNVGADKIFINSLALSKPQLITESANIFGNQCIIVAIDVIKNKKGDYYLYDYISSTPKKINLDDWIKEASDKGAGEIFINVVNKDGTYSGYDIDLAKKISSTLKIPVIFCGGAGKPSHIFDVLSNTDIAAAAVGNYLHFSEHSVITIKAFLQKKGLDIRLETYANYSNNLIADTNRVQKPNDDYLDNLLYKKFEKEII